MRIPDIALAIVVVVIVSLRAGPAVPAPLVITDTLFGTWNGQWTTPDRGVEGPVELILSRVPGRETSPRNPGQSGVQATGNCAAKWQGLARDRDACVLTQVGNQRSAPTRCPDAT
jgi:hypothetical protein